jgi:hypothetical protein
MASLTAINSASNAAHASFEAEKIRELLFSASKDACAAFEAGLLIAVTFHLLWSTRSC